MNQKITIPQKFELTKPPSVFSEDWFFLNASNFEYWVENINGKLEIKVNKIEDKCYFLISDGKLIGASYPSEDICFVFQPTDSTLNEIKIINCSVLFIYEDDGNIFFVESQEKDLREHKHLYEQIEPNENYFKPIQSPEGKVFKYGNLYQLNRINNQFNYTLILKFDDTPLAFKKHHNRLFVATSNKFIVVENFKQTIIFDNLFWEDLYPNSIAYFNDENIFIGIRGGIVKINLINKSFAFFQSNEN